MSAHTSTETLIAAKLAPATEPNWNDFGGEIQAEQDAWVLDEIVRRANAGDPVAKSHLAQERHADIKAAFAQRMASSNNRIAAIADIAVGWNVPQNYVRRVLGFLGMSTYVNVLDYDAPVVTTVTGRGIHDLSERGYDLADAIIEWLESHPGMHTPSRVGRAVKASSSDAYSVLSHLDATLCIDASGNGKWRRYGQRQTSARERIEQAEREAVRR